MGACCSFKLLLNLTNTPSSSSTFLQTLARWSLILTSSAKEVFLHSDSYLLGTLRLGALTLLSLHRHPFRLLLVLSHLQTSKAGAFSLASFISVALASIVWEVPEQIRHLPLLPIPIKILTDNTTISEMTEICSVVYSIALRCIVFDIKIEIM